MFKIRYSVLFFLLSFFSLGLFAQDTVSRIEIKGNRVISDSKVISAIKVRAGQEYNENIINLDVKALYATGFFDKVNVKRTDLPDGVLVSFELKEKPVLKEINFVGNKKLRRQRLKDIIKDVVPGVFIDDYRIQDSKRKLKDFYSSKGFNEVAIEHDLVISPDGSAKLDFLIKENRVVRIKKIIVEGNDTFTYKRIIKAIKMRPAWWLNRAVYKDDVASDDQKRLTDFYKLEGFGSVDVGIKHEVRSDGIYVFIKVEEGFRSYVGSIMVSGYKDVMLSELEKVMELKAGKPFSEYAVYEEVSRMREVYMDKGYIFCRVDPEPSFNTQTKKVDIAYNIVENNVAYIDEIQIKGNVKTKDKVIRRELRVYPGELRWER